ncbi:hypothetical protein ACEPAH_2566 [Sanghuangporus vaninii]
MGRFNPPSAYEPRSGDVRQHDNAGETPPPDNERGPMRGCHSIKEVAPTGHSDPVETSRSRRASVSFILPDDRQKDAVSPGRSGSRSSSTPPRARTPAPPSPTRRSPRPSGILLRGRNLQRAIQDRYPSILECLYSHIGDAQASPSNQQDTTDVSPIAVAARHVREYGHSAKAEALQTVGMLLKRIDQQKLDKEEVRNVFFMMCIDMFARVGIITLLSLSSDRQLCIQDPLDSIAEISLAFHLFRVLVQEQILQGNDFIRAAITLRVEGHYDACKLFIQLALDDKKTNLTEEEIKALTDIMSNPKLDQNEDKEKAA